MTYCIIKCTTSNKEDAVKIAKHLVEKKLIACCNILPCITSVYEWENKLSQDEEVLMIMKSKIQLFSQIEKEIKLLHPYKIPEIICTRIIKGNADYLNWIDKQTLTTEETF